MGGGEVQLVIIETVLASQVAPVRQVQEHQVQNAGSVELIDMPVVKPELDFLHAPPSPGIYVLENCAGYYKMKSPNWEQEN
jgi:hypothetical protein